MNSPGQKEGNLYAPARKTQRRSLRNLFGLPCAGPLQGMKGPSAAKKNISSFVSPRRNEGSPLRQRCRFPSGNCREKSKGGQGSPELVKSRACE
jgi:hypothetical protein